MTILRNFLRQSIEKSNKNNMRVSVIGERSRLDADIRAAIEDLEEATKNNTGIRFIIALNYGGRDDITRAVRRISADVKDGKLTESEITEDLIS